MMLLERDKDAGQLATRDGPVEDCNQAVDIFKAAGANVRKVATQTYGNLTAKSERTKPAAKKAVRKSVKKSKRAARKTTTRGRRKARA
jgi:hypothetical protein